ncbi:MAG: hypothetical protein OQK98_12855 [Gammaproteobacteria bacterium]|nr:hypothetical protein [Gammaproteobacteria bacterium]
MKNKTGVMFILSLLLASSFVIASEPKLILESDWLEAEVGSTGDVLGAKVVDVESHADTDTTIIEIILPVKNPQDFDNIEVIGKKSKQPLKQKSQAEWIKNDEEGIYGLRLHLKKVPRFEFQIRLIDNVNENE